MNVQVLSPALEEAYERFLQSQRRSLFFHSLRYRPFLKALVGCGDEYLVATDGDAVRGVLPLVYVEREGRRVYNSLPYYGTTAGVIADGTAAYRSLVGAYNEVATARTTVSATIVGSQFGEAPEADGIVSTHVDERIAQMTSLPAGSADPAADILGSCDGSARRNVKKAAAAGIRVERDPSAMDRLRELHEVGLRAIGGLPKGPAFFRLVREHFEPGREFDLYVARRDDVVVAGLLVFYFNQTVEYFVPASDSASRDVQPLSAILIAAMTEAARRGFRWWNWGGTWTTQTGVYRFKRKWGARECVYRHRTQLNEPALLAWPPERILSTWPHFFVVPFRALTSPAVST